MQTFETPAPISAVLDLPAGRVHLIAADRADTLVEIHEKAVSGPGVTITRTATPRNASSWLTTPSRPDASSHQRHTAPGGGPGGGPGLGKRPKSSR